jgi:uncharacterized protein (DUF2236 family)
VNRVVGERLTVLGWGRAILTQLAHPLDRVPARSRPAPHPVGLLPPPIRELYGFEWNHHGERRLAMVLNELKRMRAVSPERLARWADARDRPL